MEDIHNVAEYTSKSKGVSYVYDDEYEQAKRKLQAKGGSIDLGVSGVAGKIWLTGLNGGVVVDPNVIISEMSGWGGNWDYAGGGS